FCFLCDKEINYSLPWQFLNFLPLPQGQGSLRPILGSTLIGSCFTFSDGSWYSFSCDKYSGEPEAEAPANSSLRWRILLISVLLFLSSVIRLAWFCSAGM